MISISEGGVGYDIIYDDCGGGGSLQFNNSADFLCNWVFPKITFNCL